MSLTTKSRRKKNRIPSDTFTGIRIKSATVAIGANIFNLIEVKRTQIKTLLANTKIFASSDQNMLGP